jgi:uncharacterized RDD family membrane protein YckC
MADLGSPVAGLERRFYAFVIDGLIGWGLVASGCWAAYRLFWWDDRLWPGLVVLAVVVASVWLVFALTLGASGATPGGAATGLRVVDVVTLSPIGVPRALLRGLVVGLATVPMFGLGLAILAWTAALDPGRRRRGWHDHLARSVVVDVRPRPAVDAEPGSAPRHVVNLTAMRLVPAARSTPPQGTVRRATPAPAPAPAVTPTAPPGWVVAFDTGEQVVVDGLVLVGRRPQARPGEDVQHLVALPSSDMSLSHTHAQVRVADDGALVVMDRGSTNGTVLTRGGVSRPLTTGRPATLLDGDVLRFGDRSARVSRQG